MNDLVDANILKAEFENCNMQIKLLEREIKELNKQNYQLMTRISHLCDELRSLGGSINNLP
jgi:chaperonin cofactor prefoldin